MTSDREWLRLVIDLRLPIPPQDAFAGLGPKEYRAEVASTIIGSLNTAFAAADTGIAVVAAWAGPPPPGTHPPNPTLTRVDYDTGEVL